MTDGDSDEDDIGYNPDKPSSSNVAKLSKCLNKSSKGRSQSVPGDSGATKSSSVGRSLTKPVSSGQVCAESDAGCPNGVRSLDSGKDKAKTDHFPGNDVDSDVNRPIGVRSLDFDSELATDRLPESPEDVDDSDLEELNSLKRRRESVESDDEPIQKSRKKCGLKRYLKRPENIDDFFTDVTEVANNPNDVIKLIKKSTRQPRNAESITHVIDFVHNNREFRLNQSDVTSSGTIKFLCSKRKYDSSKDEKAGRCKGGCEILIRDLNIVSEKQVSNRTKFFVTKELTKADFMVTEHMAHSCHEKTPTEMYEDKVTAMGIQLAIRQKENQLNLRKILPSEIFDHSVVALRESMTAEEFETQSNQTNKINSRRVIDRISRILRKDDKTDPPVNLDNRMSFDEYPLEFFTGSFVFDKEFAQTEQNESWLFFNPHVLKKLDSLTDGVSIQDNTWTFGSKAKDAPDCRHFKFLWKLRLVKNGMNELVAFACMSRQTSAAFQKLFERLKIKNNGNVLKSQYLVMDRERALLRSADDAGFQRDETLFCSFHFVHNEVKHLNKDGFKKYLCMKNPIAPKSKFIVRTFQLIRAVPYLPVFLSKTLLQFNLEEMTTDEMNRNLGEVDSFSLQSIIQRILRDLGQNGEHISWYPTLMRAGKWVDCTSQVNK